MTVKRIIPAFAILGGLLGAAAGTATTAHAATVASAPQTWYHT